MCLRARQEPVKEALSASLANRNFPLLITKQAPGISIPQRLPIPPPGKRAASGQHQIACSIDSEASIQRCCSRARSQPRLEAPHVATEVGQG